MSGWVTEPTAPTRVVQVTFDAADPKALSVFWAHALGYVNDDPPAGFTTWEEALEALGVPSERRNSASAIHHPEDGGPRVFFQQVPEAKAGKNRVHLDVRAAPGLDGDERMAALEAECVRLVGLGATRVSRFEPEPPMSAGFIVMQDPEGNEFCLD